MSRIEELADRLQLRTLGQRKRAPSERDDAVARELFLIWREQAHDLFALARYDGSGALVMPALAAEALYAQASGAWSDMPEATRRGDYENAERVRRAGQK